VCWRAQHAYTRTRTRQSLHSAQRLTQRPRTCTPIQFPSLPISYTCRTQLATESTHGPWHGRPGTSYAVSSVCECVQHSCAECAGFRAKPRGSANRPAIKAIDQTTRICVWTVEPVRLRERRGPWRRRWQTGPRRGTSQAIHKHALEKAMPRGHGRRCRATRS